VIILFDFFVFVDECIMSMGLSKRIRGVVEAFQNLIDCTVLVVVVLFFAERIGLEEAKKTTAYLAEVFVAHAVFVLMFELKDYEAIDVGSVRLVGRTPG
jgi:hypothetical protein